MKRLAKWSLAFVHRQVIYVCMATFGASFSSVAASHNWKIYTVRGVDGYACFFGGFLMVCVCSLSERSLIYMLLNVRRYLVLEWRRVARVGMVYQARL